MSYGRRKSDGVAQALLWVQALALAALWAVNLAYLARLGEAGADAKAAAMSMRAEATAAKKERIAFGRAASAFIQGLKQMGIVREAE